MALIKCKDCGAEVSEKATACVKCGAPLTHETAVVKFLTSCIMFAIGCLVLWGLVTVAKHVGVANDGGTNASAIPPTIKPDAIYTSLPGNITCPTEDLLLEAIKHANDGEKTLFLQMLAINGGPCMTFPAGVQVRVLSVDGSQSVSHAIIRFNLADTPNAGGGWAIDQLIKSSP